MGDSSTINFADYRTRDIAASRAFPHNLEADLAGACVGQGPSTILWNCYWPQGAGSMYGVAPGLRGERLGREGLMGWSAWIRFGEIRRAYFEQERPIKEIVRTLSVSRATVRKIIRGHQTEFKYARDVQPTPKLGVWVEALTEILESESKLAKRERRSTQRLFEELRGRGYDGAHDSVHRFVRSWREERARVPAHAYVPMSLRRGKPISSIGATRRSRFRGFPNPALLFEPTLRRSQRVGTQLADANAPLLAGDEDLALFKHPDAARDRQRSRARWRVARSPSNGRRPQGNETRDQGEPLG